MTEMNRRTALSGMLTLTAVSTSLHMPALAQSQSQGTTANPAAGPNLPPRLSFADITRRARDLNAAPFTAGPTLPDQLAKLDEENWRDIHFRSDKSFLTGTNFRVQPIHLGGAYRHPLTINLVRDGIATPIPYASNLFDYGHTKFDRNLPVNSGFAGVQLFSRLNDPRLFDLFFDMTSPSTFRLTGRDQHMGVNARALTINAGTPEEDIPFFREIWIETPEATSDKLTLYALIDSVSITGAMKIDLNVSATPQADISLTLYPRKANIKIGCAPLATLFYASESTRKLAKDHRPEIHDSDGLLMNSGTGEWIWRPLRNPDKLTTTAFLDQNIRGFGFIQRDRNFDHYQDLDAHYETHPSLWIEPQDNWGNGRIEMVERPTADINAPNVTASWVFTNPVQIGNALSFSYRMTAYADHPRLSPNARVINTFQENTHTLGSSEPITPTKRRFILDFAGGDLSYYQDNPQSVEFVPSTTSGRIIKKDLVYNPAINGFRAQFDVDLGKEGATDLRAFLRVGNRTLSETWTFPWIADEPI
jgi:periplasmic glucans biosynthesis protein